MYNLDFSYKSLEQRQKEKRKEEFKEEKIIQDLKFDEIDSKRALEIFNPLNNINNPDVPEITYSIIEKRISSKRIMMIRVHS